MLLGDRPLYDPATGNPDGTLTFRVTVIRDLSGGDQLFGVNADVKLNNGMIAVQDSFSAKSTQSTRAIVGGAGKFHKVRGTATRQVIDPTTVEFTYDYTP